MTSVYADPNAALVFHTVYYVTNLFKLIANVAALSGGVLYHGTNTVCFVESNIYGLGNTIQTLLYRNFLQMASRMKIKQLQTELLATLHVVKESGS